MTALDAFFESYYRLRPVNATFTGIHTHDDRLPDWSPDGLEAAADEMRSLRASLDDVPTDAEALQNVAVRDRALAIAFLDIQLAELDTLHFQRGNPSLALGEAAFGVISLVTRPFAPAADRARSLASRLDAWPVFLAGARESIDHELRIVNPAPQREIRFVEAAKVSTQQPELLRFVRGPRHRRHRLVFRAPFTEDFGERCEKGP